jgi:hypothetical protein
LRVARKAAQMVERTVRCSVGDLVALTAARSAALTAGWRAATSE